MTRLTCSPTRTACVWRVQHTLAFRTRAGILRGKLQRKPTKLRRRTRARMPGPPDITRLLLGYRFPNSTHAANAAKIAYLYKLIREDRRDEIAEFDWSEEGEALDALDVNQIDGDDLDDRKILQTIAVLGVVGAADDPAETIRNLSDYERPRSFMKPNRVFPGNEVRARVCACGDEA